MNKALKTVASSVAALSITAGGAFAQDEKTLQRQDVRADLDSATVCSVDDGSSQKFLDVRSIRQCFDYAVDATARTVHAQVHATAYRGHVPVKEFVCSNNFYNDEQLTCKSLNVQSP